MYGTFSTTFTLLLAPSGNAYWSCPHKLHRQFQMTSFTRIYLLDSSSPHLSFFLACFLPTTLCVSPTFLGFLEQRHGTQQPRTEKNSSGDDVFTSDKTRKRWKSAQVMGNPLSFLSGSWILQQKAQMGLPVQFTRQRETARGGVGLMMDVLQLS